MYLKELYCISKEFKFIGLENIVHTAGYENYIYILIVIGIWVFKMMKKANAKKSVFVPNTAVEEEYELLHNEENRNINVDNDSYEDVKVETVPVSGNSYQSISEARKDNVKGRKLEEPIDLDTAVKPRKTHRIFRQTGLKNALVLKEVLERKHF